MNPDQPKRRIQARPEGVATMIMLGLISSAGMFAANILPVLVAALRSGLAYSARDAGFIGATNVYGAAFGAAAAAFLVKRMPWRVTIAVGLVVMICIDGLSSFIASFPVLCSLRFVHGFIGGVTVGLGFSVIARTPTPDRTFGMLMLVQFGLAGICVAVLPRLIGSLGSSAAFLGLAAISLAALAALPFIPEYVAKTATVVEKNSGFNSRSAMAMAFIGLFLFQATKMSLYSYIFGLGQSLQHSTAFLSTVLGIAAGLGALGAIAVVLLGLKFGRFRPLATVMSITLLAYFALLLYGAIPAVFAMSEMFTIVAWAFIAPYLFGMCAAFDSSGQAAAWTSFFSKLGMATGPALGGLVLAETHYERLIWLAIAGLVLSGVIAAWPALQLDKLNSAATGNAAR